MKKNRIILLSVVVLSTIIVASGFTKDSFVSQKTEIAIKEVLPQSINMFVTHGHCSLPFSGKVDDLKVDYTKRYDKGNSLEDMKISFNIDPNTFNVCRGDDLTSLIKTPGLFINEDNDKIIFRTTNVYTMGLDWYQINGQLSIKGEERPVKFFATGIRNQKEFMTTLMILEGQIDLADWGIDYDKIVSGKSNSIPTKWLHLNMKFEVS